MDIKGLSIERIVWNKLCLKFKKIKEFKLQWKSDHYEKTFKKLVFFPRDGLRFDSN